MRAWIASKGVRRTEPEFELRDALGQSGCAVCRLALRTAARQLDILSYENVNDLDLRARLRDSRGFCNRHAWQLLDQTRDPLGVALIYKDVINTLIPELRPDGLLDGLVARLRGHRANALAGRLAARSECPVCLAERETEDIYLRLLGARIAEPSFRDAWEKSSGLCWPHLLAALPRARSDEALALLTSPRQEGEAKTDLTPVPFPVPFPVPSPDPGNEGDDGDTARSSGSSVSPPPPGDDQGESQPPESLPLAQGEGGFPTIRALALSHGRWSAPRSLLPPNLVVDLQQRRLEAVTRPAGDRQPECHVCQEVAEAMERRLGGMLAEGVAAEMLGDICERHAWQLAQRKAGDLTVALEALAVHRREALTQALERARAERPAVIAPGQTAAGWVGERAGALLRTPVGANSGGCPLCGQQFVLDGEVIVGVIGMRRPVALCRIHLSIAAALPKPPHWPSLLAHQAARWGQLSLSLAEFIRKHDYRFSSEPRGEERDSPWLAVEEIAGRKGMA